MKHQLTAKVSVELSEPVVVAVSVPGEKRWGVHQFPALSRLPDGAILVAYADALDSFETHGTEAPAFVSKDAGKSWQAYQGPLKSIRPHFSVSEVYQGEYLAAPARPYLNWRKEKIELPKPVSEVNIYGPRQYFALEDLPPKAQTHFGVLYGERYDPESKRWSESRIRYDTQNRIAVRYVNSYGDVLPQTFFERTLLKHDGELFYADYRGQYRMADERPPIKGILTCMASTDNGHSFKRRGTISADRTGKNLRGEGHLAVTTDGRLVCVLRQQDQELKPMKICWSADKGKTWTESKDLFNFGVFPCILPFGNGIMALSYGRPGVCLSFAMDGTGEKWSDPITLVKGNDSNVMQHSCGYTSLLALDDNSFLLAYSDFLHRRPDGKVCKAIVVRTVRMMR